MVSKQTTASETSLHTLCVYDPECAEYIGVFTGSLTDCLSKQGALRHLLTADNILNCLDNKVKVTIKPAPKVLVSGIRTIEAPPFADEDEDAEDSTMVFGYEHEKDEAPEDRVWFNPPSDSTFKVGDRVAMLAFSEGGYGGWTISNLDFTHSEYWSA